MRPTACGLLLCLLLSPFSRAETVTVEGLSILYEKPYAAAFAAELSSRFVVVAVDQRTGTHCTVRLRPLDDATSPSAASELRPWQPSDKLPLEQVQADWIGGQLRLAIRFNKVVSCSFQISSDQQSLWVAVEAVDEKTDQQIKSQMQKARDALLAGNYELAIRLYRDVVDGSRYRNQRHPLKQKAMEYLGVALERQGHYEQAVRVYQRYLDEYSDANARARIEQRLQGLTNMTQTDKTRLRKATPDTSKPMRWYGVMSTGYQLYQSDNGGSTIKTEQSSLLTDLNLNGRYRDTETDMKVLVSTGYEHDFVRELDHPGRLSKAYLDLFHSNTGQQFRLGRQSTSGEGILGRYDGFHYHKIISARFGINAVLGFPVASSRDFNVEQERRVYGVSLDITAPDSPWQSNVFMTHQETRGYTDRQAVGGEIRYLTQTHNLLMYLDYDTYFNELNTITVNGNWFAQQDAHYYLTMDYRRSPTLTLSNALIGQTLSDLDQLAQSGLSESDLEEVALDRSAISKSLNIGASRRFHPHFRWAADAGLWELSGTDSSLGVNGFEGSDLETNLRLQLLGNDLLQDRDLLWLTLRVADLSTSRLVAVTTDWRVPLNSSWRLRPKCQVYQRTFTDIDGKQTSLQPSMRIEYKANKAWQFETNLGGEWLSTEQNGNQIDVFNLLVSLRADWLF